MRSQVSRYFSTNAQLFAAGKSASSGYPAEALTEDGQGSLALID